MTGPSYTSRSRRDLEAGLLRVLHARSFEDDPTRALRAARYAARFGFELEPETAELLGQTDLSTVSGDVELDVRRGVEVVGFETGPHPTPVVAVILSDRETGLPLRNSATLPEATMLPPRTMPTRSCAP